jgi:hypothetical protein
MCSQDCVDLKECYSQLTVGVYCSTCTMVRGAISDGVKINMKIWHAEQDQDEQIMNNFLFCLGILSGIDIVQG